MGAALHFNNFLLIIRAFWRIFGESNGLLFKPYSFSKPEDLQSMQPSFAIRLML